METSAKLGISMKEVTDKLTDDGCACSPRPSTNCSTAVEKSSKSQMSAQVSLQTYKLPAALAAAVKANIEDWRKADKVRRLWQHDASLWTGTDEAKWLGWLDITDEQIAHVDTTARSCRRRKEGGLHRHPAAGHGRFESVSRSLDDFRQDRRLPRAARSRFHRSRAGQGFENKVDLAKTLFIVSSKSGSTLEPNIFKQYFFERVKQTVGADKAGSRFIAITDPGSKMQQVAEAITSATFSSACPASAAAIPRFPISAWCRPRVMGLDVDTFPRPHRRKWWRPARANVPVEQNPGVLLGIILGTRRAIGRDKAHHRRLARNFRARRVARATDRRIHGQARQGHHPRGSRRRSVRPKFTATIAYSLICVWNPRRTRRRTPKVAALEQAGHPVVRIAVADIYDLGQEFFRWEIATAVAGSIIGINAFNQPDVEASKIATRKSDQRIRKDRLAARREARFSKTTASSCLPTTRMPTLWRKRAGTDQIARGISAARI